MNEQERLETLAAVLDQLPYLVAVTAGDDHGLVLLNAKGRELLGDRPVGVPLSAWPGELGSRLAARHDQVRSTGEPSPDDEWQLETAGSNGQPVELVVNIATLPIRHPDGTVRAVVGLGEDVTEHVRGRPVEALQQLQDALLPTGLPVPQGVELAARCLLAEADAGGDWFDAIALADGRLVVVVGDVVGHGIASAVVMGELKAVFEERVRQDGDVVAALELLDARASRVEEARATTLCACLLDPVSGELEYVTAGHPPPVLVSDGGATFLPSSGAGPLGSGLPVTAARHRLVAGDLLVLYSDGLVERPGRTPAENTMDLLRVVADTAAGPVRPPAPRVEEPVTERVCRRSLELLTQASGYADDITLLALRLVPRVAPLELRLPAVPDAVRTARADVADWLAGLWISSLDRAAVLHAVGELVSNAVRHAYSAVDVRNPVDVDLRLSPDGVVELSVADRGSWREPGPEAGDGLALAAGLLDVFRLEHDGSGTRATGRHRVTHAAALLRGESRARPVPSGVFGLDVVDDVVHVTGALDARAADDLRHALARASHGGSRRVTVGLAGADVLSSAAVRVLLEARAAGPLELLAPNGSPAQHVLDLVRLPYVS